MNRKELIDGVKEKIDDYSRQDVVLAVDTFFQSIKDALLREERVELRGFGVFSVTTREARMARNPKTGESVYRPPTRYLLFRGGKELTEMINDRKETHDL